MNDHKKRKKVREYVLLDPVLQHKLRLYPIVKNVKRVDLINELISNALKTYEEQNLDSEYVKTLNHELEHKFPACN